ncbi:MAG: hypothetical protein MJ145_04585, partial [Clostridia bacterium]|nr:hypothetical protein [Clostridia bacterium]
MKKAKIMAVVLSATLVFTSSSVCFAAEGIDGEQIQAEATAELVEDITGTADINKDIEETSDGFEVEGESVDVTLPEDGDGNIVMDSEEESIGMGLPKEVQDEEGILTDEGTVIYGATQDVSVAVQAG